MYKEEIKVKERLMNNANFDISINSTNISIFDANIGANTANIGTIIIIITTSNKISKILFIQ